MAVRVGFEPTVAFNSYNALAKRRFRPLSHLTKIARRIYGEKLAGVKSKSEFLENVASFPDRRVANVGPMVSYFRRSTISGLLGVCLFVAGGCAAMKKLLPEKKPKTEEKVPTAA